MSLSIEVSGLYKAYGGNIVLSGCTYSFEQSGIYALMGPNGSGKSTLLRLLALIENPDKGEVNYSSGGRALPKDLSLRRRVTLLLPAVGLFNTTVLNNASYGLRIRGIGRKEAAERAEGALELSGLISKRSHNALALSSGEARRLGMARALAIEPEVLFLDEPTAYIDRENTAKIEDIILGMEKKLVIIATHDMAQARRLSGRTLRMEEGKILVP